MRRIISSLLAIVLLVTMLYQTSVIAYAADEPTFTVSSEQANPGQNVSVAIRMDHNPGIASVKLKAQFDRDLILTGITYNPALGGMSQQPEKMTSPVSLNWFNGAEDTAGDMVYAVLDFTVAESASAGEHAVTITYDKEDVYNIAENNIAFNIVNGGVTVTYPVTGLSLDHTTATAATGNHTYTLKPVFTPADATNQNVSWQSSDETVATVDAGVVTLLKKGEVVITATSEDGGFEATCTLTVLCSHLTYDVISAEVSTCIKHGHDTYTVCRECGEIISGSDAPLPYADHQYVEDVQPQYLKSAATCISPAIYYKSCSVCGEQGTETFTYGAVDPDHHVGTTHLKNQEETSCKKEGYTGDVVCDDCGTVLIPGSVIAKSDHVPGVPVRENEIPASCEETGEYDEVIYCSVCGEELSREHKIALELGHTYGDPLWTWDGYDSAAATFSCIRGDDVQTLEATIKMTVVKEPSAAGDGERVYLATVTFDGETYTDEKTESIPRSILLGDVDGDGKVTILDATAIQRKLAGLPTAFAELAADTDQDGKMTILDATAIQRWLAGLPTNENIATIIA